MVPSTKIPITQKLRPRLLLTKLPRFMHALAAALSIFMGKLVGEVRIACCS